MNTTLRAAACRVAAPLAAVAASVVGVGLVANPATASASAGTVQTATQATAQTSTGAQPGDLLAAPEPTGCAADPAPGHAQCLSEAAPIVPPTHGMTDPAPLAAPQVAPNVKTAPKSFTPAVSSGPYSPADLASIYRLPTSTTNATIGIVDAGSNPNVAANLAEFRNSFGLPACTKANGCLTEMSQTGSTTSLPTENQNWDPEIDLDVQAVSAICPTCKILLISTNDSGMNNMLTGAQTAVAHGADYVSMSFGAGEWSGATSYTSTYLNSPDTIYVASTGDDGYEPAVSYPASSTKVLAAGGTTITHTGPEGAANEWTQTAWNGAGSGCSVYEPQPAEQAGVAALASSCGKKANADLSAIADPSTGLMVYSDGTWWSMGGTSLAAPVIASMYALAGNHANPRSFYGNDATNPLDFTDVTSGTTLACNSTVLCKAGAGWDGPTGLGTPNGLGGLSASGAAHAQPGNLVLTTPANTSTVVNTRNSWDASVQGTTTDTVTYTATGLPTGMTINDGTGTISGTPTVRATGHATVTAQMTNTRGVLATGTTQFDWAVTKAAPVSLLFGIGGSGGQVQVGQDVDWSVYATNAPAGAKTFTATGVPAGMRFDTATGRAAGRPTTVSEGTMTVTETITDSDGEVVGEGSTWFTWTVNPAPPITLALYSPGSPSVRYGASVNWNTAVGSPPAGTLTYTATGLPSGTKVGANGYVTGKPTRIGSGTATITATVTSGGTIVAIGARQFTWKVSSATLTLRSPGSPSVHYGAAVYWNIAVGSRPAGTLTYTAKGLPAGTRVGPNGAVTGKVIRVSSGTVTITAKVTNSAAGGVVATGARRLPWKVVAVPLALHSPGKPTVKAGVAVNWNAAVGSRPAGTLTYTAKGLPADTKIAPSGHVTGKPTRASSRTATITARVRTSAGVIATGSVRFTWKVTARKFVRTGAIKAKGIPRIGRLLTATIGVLHRDTREGAVVHPKVRYQWLANGKKIPGATKVKYRTAKKYKGNRLSFQVTVQASGFATATYTSAKTRAVR